MKPVDYRILFVAVSLGLMGCSGEPREASSDVVAPAGDLEPAEIDITQPRIPVPAPSSPGNEAAAPGSEQALATTGTAVLRPEDIVAQPSQYPVYMSQTVNLRRRVVALPPDATSIPEDLAAELDRYGDQMLEFVKQEESTIPPRQLMEIEEFAGKLEYQATRVQNGEYAPEVMRSVIDGMQNHLEQIQQQLAAPAASE